MPTLVGSAFLLLAFASCAGRTASPAESAAIPEGIWGGDGARLVVADGYGLLDIPCAEARSESPMRLDENRQFDIAATLQRITGVPPRAESPSEVPTETVRLQGKVSGDTVLIRVVFADGQTSESVALTRGREGSVPQCG